MSDGTLKVIDKTGTQVPMEALLAEFCEEALLLIAFIE